MRKQADPTNVFLIVMSLSTQDYGLPGQFQLGAAAYVSLTVIDDMRVTTLHHSLVVALGYPFEGPVYSVYTERGVSENGFVILENVSTNASATYKRRVYTANRCGFYIKSE
ncbi:hypothetical protein Poli38472_004233 [Pythium oligandrum]|uniref:Uncharacterized protein n=1 Tax=Pythium oligandrum TaxID=41045 RepID=A0A8K1CP52_PYTOL|nr:hypothetical protein Poli38472_004233 [Pythium oligandrum]|eukprot:TMW66468.1 hypothetical protein Poli38472_004233 [Pythium oligandrum]